MFTGIIECMGELHERIEEQDNIHFNLSSQISDQLKVDQSVAHDGVCLTVTQLKPGAHIVTAVRETLLKTQLKHWEIGRQVNLERALKMGDRLDGHMVQGHVDQTAKCIARQEQGGSWKYTFELNQPHLGQLIEKGSVAVNGVSLTCVNVSERQFQVAIIPYTFEHTNFCKILPQDVVNIEFDVLGKYILAQHQHKKIDYQR